MTEFDEYDQILNTALDKLQKELDSLTKKDYSQKANVIKKCQTQVKNISTLIDSYELEICNIDKAQSGKYNDSLIAVCRKFARMKAELEVKKKYGVTDLFKGLKIQNGPEQTEAQQMIDLGDQTQKKAISALDGMIKTIHASNQMADDINIELDKQIQQLDRMHDTIKDTQTTLKRTGKYNKDQLRQVYTDKLLMCLIFLIFIAIVALIIMQAMGFDAGKSVSKSDSVSITNTSKILVNATRTS